MTRRGLKQIVTELGDACHVLELALPELTDAAVVALHLQRVLDFAQQQLDDQRPQFRETAGNHWRAARSGGQRLCRVCRRYWAPAGEECCALCVKVRDYVPRVYTDEEREVYLREIEAITQGRHHLVPSKETDE